MDHNGKVMKSFHYLSERIITISLIFGMMVMVFFFAPSQFGGMTTFLVVSGVSMEPLFNKGDLAIVRVKDDYQAGDVVAYRNQDLSGLPVIHRIIKTESGDYFLKGDNNAWIDSYYPKKEEIIGKLWIFIPKFGGIIQWFSTPSHLIAILLLTGGVFMIKPFSKEKKKRNKTKVDLSEYTSLIEGVTIGAFILASLFLVFVIFTFSRPLLQTPQKISYTQSGIFGYTASSVPGVYDNNSIQAGEPIYTKLTCKVNFNYQYNFVGNESAQAAGKQSFSILIQDPSSGWKRTITDSGEQVFTSNSYTAKNTIDVCQIQRIIENYLTTAEADSKLFYLEIIPKTYVQGTVDGQVFSSTFEPKLTLYFDQTHLYLPSSNQEGNPLVVVQDGSFTSNTSKPNTMTFFGSQPTVKTMRIIALVGLFIYLLLLGIIGYIFFIVAKKNEDESIRLRFHNLLVDIQDSSSEFSPKTNFFDMATIGDLAKIAERDSTVIMHILSDNQTTGQKYVVKTEKGFYRYNSKMTPPSEEHVTSISEPSNGEIKKGPR